MPEKTRIRRELLARRAAEPGRDRKSAVIAERIRAMPAFAAAGTVAVYVGVGPEVATLPLIAELFAAGRRVAVPWVDRGELRLFELRSLDELAPAPFGLLEPPAELRELAGRSMEPAEVDLFLVPGVAFDRAGGRLGHGRGYYDRLLARARPDAGRVALAFECQLVDRVPMTPADVPMHWVVTEAGSHQGAPSP